MNNFREGVRPPPKAVITVSRAKAYLFGAWETWVWIFTYGEKYRITTSDSVTAKKRKSYHRTNRF